MFTPDCAEYGRFKSGTEAKGITFAVQTFMAKLTGSISGALGLADSQQLFQHCDDD